MLRSIVLPLRLAAVLLAALLLCAATARAESAATATPPPLRRILEISLSSRPAELVSAGEVMLSFSIANNSDFDAQNVYLISADGLHSEPLGQIGAGEVQTFNRSYTVTETELDSGEISFVVSHDSPNLGAEPVSYTVSTPIARSIAAPQAEFTTQLSSDCAPAGGTVTVTYRVRNTGNVPLTQLRVNDTLGDFVGRVEMLDVGETRVFTGHVTINAAARSEPSLSYTVPAEDGRTYETELSPRTIAIAAPELSLSFAADCETAEPGGTVTLTLMLRNLGNVGYRHITVTDAVRGDLVASSQTLPAGSDPLLVSRVYPVRGDGEYQFHVSAVCETGERVNMDTERIAVPMSAPRAAGGIELSASTETPVIRRSGNVTFDLSLSTNAAEGVRDVRLSEQTRGEIRTFEIIPAGGPLCAQASYPVSEDSEFTFIADWTDAQGTHIVRALPVEVAIGRDGVEPDADEKSGEGLSATARVLVGEGSVYIYLIAGGVLVLIGLIFALWITSRKERRASREREAQQRQKRREELEKTNPFVPVKQRSRKERRRDKKADPE